MRKNSLADPSADPSPKGTRITVTVPATDYELVRQMAKARKVSASWIVRDAVEKYVHQVSSLGGAMDVQTRT